MLQCMHTLPLIQNTPEKHAIACIITLNKMDTITTNEGRLKQSKSLKPFDEVQHGENVSLLDYSSQRQSIQRKQIELEIVQ